MRTDTRRVEIKKEIMDAANNGIFVSKNKACKILNISKNGLDEFLSGLEYWQRGNRQYYLVSDIAGRIYYSMANSVLDRYYVGAIRRPDHRGMAYQQITRELIKYSNDIDTPEFNRSSFATANQICNLLDMSMKTFKTYFGDLEFFTAGRKRLYLLSDVAKRIHASREKT